MMITHDDEKEKDVTLMYCRLRFGLDKSLSERRDSRSMIKHQRRLNRTGKHVNKNKGRKRRE